MSVLNARPGICKSCGADIVWVTTVAGNSMPLDKEARAGGNVDILLDGTAKVVKPDANTIRSVSHFVSCPNANAHRRKK